MDKGIKPTRLWHLSGKKHIQNWLNDRITAAKHDLDQRPQKEMLKLCAVILTSVLGFAYSYGCFSPEKYLATIIKSYSPNDCKKKCGTEVPVPCADNTKKADKPCSK